LAGVSNLSIELTEDATGCSLIEYSPNELGRITEGIASSVASTHFLHDPENK
jgi:hypothetical protein